ncbi:MAG: DNA mismatch repair protein MutS, partial [Clostridia bacterium]|nr:DNA mismatch repair protein MutS [Clostridia bacterium]
AVSFVDTSTGRLHLAMLGDSRINESVIGELGRFTPKEVIMNRDAADSLVVSFIQKKLGCCYGVMDVESFDPNTYTDLVTKHFHVSKPEEINLPSGSAALFSVAAALDYLFDTQMTGLENINSIEIYNNKEFMQIDLSARRNLELFNNSRSGSKRGSLMWILNQTKTPMGRRMLTEWLERPLIRPEDINRRLYAVDELHSNSAFCQELSQILRGIYDMERLITRIVYRSASPKDLLHLSHAVEDLPILRAKIASCRSDLLLKVYEDIDELQDITQLVEAAIDPEAPANMKDGHVIREGYHEELDRIRSDAKLGRNLINQMEEQEREKTGIKTLKIKHNKVFGYYIEITNSFKDLTPEHYIRKQTTVNSERYITADLKVLEDRVSGASERAIALEHQLYAQVREQLAEKLSRVQRTAAAVATLDVLLSFAVVALERNYVCPTVATDGSLIIKDGRHPVVETVSDLPFVPNDCVLDQKEHRCAIITGPNMAGKSTFMRQVALITIMTQ